jgi:hypothetical protein
MAFIPLVGQPTTATDSVWYSDDIARVPLLITAEPDVGSIRVRCGRGSSDEVDSSSYQLVATRDESRHTASRAGPL